jgi:hypothetical protein
VSASAHGSKRFSNLAVRVRRVEKSPLSNGSPSGSTSVCLGAEILQYAGECHDFLDRLLGLHSHSLMAGVRAAFADGFLNKTLADRLTRLARSADAISHTVHPRPSDWCLLISQMLTAICTCVPPTEMTRPPTQSWWRLPATPTPLRTPSPPLALISAAASALLSSCLDAQGHVLCARLAAIRLEMVSADEEFIDCFASSPPFGTVDAISCTDFYQPDATSSNDSMKDLEALRLSTLLALRGLARSEYCLCVDIFNIYGIVFDVPPTFF